MTWAAPDDLLKVTQYVVYLATDSGGTVESAIGSHVIVGTNQMSVPGDTLSAPFTYLVVFTRSSHVEQATPASLVFNAVPAV
jgi:hypothetical protein